MIKVLSLQRLFAKTIALPRFNPYFARGPALQQRVAYNFAMGGGR